MKQQFTFFVSRTIKKSMKNILLSLTCIIFSFTSSAQNNDSLWLAKNYYKIERRIPMRDGVKLFTAIYIPRDKTEKHPFLMTRTPYSVYPYGEDKIPRFYLGYTWAYLKENYIIVRQDVRGRYMSEGVNLEVTPHIAIKKGNNDVDESSDTWDTIDWLLKNIENNNGRVGIYGISYPGFYATASLPGAHPAIKAVSPQASVTDEFIGDDVNHNGAYFLLDNFDFMNSFGKERIGLVQDYGGNIFPSSRTDAYQYFLKMGPLKNTQSKEYFDHRSYIWNEYLVHDTYDSYWKARNIRTHLKNITVPTLVVGGWFDAEDLFGALNTYGAIEKQSPKNNNRLVMGPWTHGAWTSGEWKNFVTHNFGSNTSAYFQDIEVRFFNYYLKDKGNFKAAEATMFETGSNTWKTYNTWPPSGVTPTNLYFGPNNNLTSQTTNYKPQTINSFTKYISDPSNPVPYTNGKFARRNNRYMVEDQRFAASRNDVIVFETAPLEKDMTVTGKILADLFVSTTATDADFIVKLIDVIDGNEIGPGMESYSMAGFQRLVRAEVMRGKFRNSFEKPEPFIPNKITEVKFALNDVDHTFKKGHRIMVQVQSSWFPLVDINPQRFMRIPDADVKDFQKATIRIYHDGKNNSRIILPVLNK
jgi:putative CocE/NonD family hydrolase